jgi:CubicO group peptidase (beta-lactamase class C family)
MRRFLAGLCLCVAACSPVDAPADQDGIDSGEDYFPGEEWRTATPAQLDLDAGRINALIDNAQSGRFGSLHGLIVVRNGYVAVEEYFNWTPSQAHTMQSISKSVTSLLFGLVHQQHAAATPLNRTVLDMLPQYAGRLTNVDARKQSLTLRHMLTMRTGIDFYEQPYEGSPLAELNQSRGDWVKLVLDRPMRSAPGSEWAYNSGSPIVMCGLMRDLTGEGVDAFAQRELFDPIGVRDAWWYRSPFDGLPHCGGGLNLRPMDLARIGYLVLREGRWGSRQLVSKSWIEDSTAPHSTGSSLIFSSFNSSYGYYWWGFPDRRGGTNRTVIAASGSGGQWLFVVPDLDLVVAIVAENGAGLDLFYDGVLPAIKD